MSPVLVKKKCVPVKKRGRSSQKRLARRSTDQLISDIRKERERADKNAKARDKYKRQTADLKKKIAELEQKLVQATLKGIEQEKSMQNILKEAETIRGQRFELYETDSVVAGSFRILFDRTRSWSKKWSKRNVDKDVCEDTSWFLNDEAAGEPAVGSEKATKAFKDGILPVSVAVNACINGQLCGKIFDSPFKILYPQTNTPDMQANPIDDMVTTLVSKVQMHSIRAEIVRILELPNRKFHRSSALQVQQMMRKRKQDFGKQLTKQIVRGLQGLLVCRTQEGSEDYCHCEEELESIASGAIDLSIKLFAQKSNFTYNFFSGLKKYWFSIHHKHMKAHRVLKLDESDDEIEGTARRFNNSKIDLVVEPKIVRHGDEDGLNTDKPVVVVKATIWFDKNNLHSRSKHTIKDHNLTDIDTDTDTIEEADNSSGMHHTADFETDQNESLAVKTRKKSPKKLLSKRKQCGNPNEDDFEPNVTTKEY